MNAAERQPLSAAFLLVTLALLVRLAFLLIAHGFHFVTSTGPYPALFLNETTNIASSIASGNGYCSPFFGILFGKLKLGPTSWIAPVYPYFCAAVFRVFGPFSRPSFFILVLIQCIISALTCVPILRIGERTVGRRAGIIAAVLWAVFPWFSQWANTYIWEISLSALLFAWLFWYALRLELEQAWKPWLGFGALWGFALLVNPALLTLLVASLLWLGFQRWRAKLPSFKRVLLSVVTCLIVITPWLVRNRVVFGQWAFLRTNFWFEFWLSNYHGGAGRDWAGRHPTTNLEERAEYARVGEIEYVREKSIAAKQFVRDYPAEFAGFTAKRILSYWDGSTIKYNYPAAPYWLPWSYPLLSLLLVPALLMAIVRRVHGWGLYLWAILLYPLPYYITFNQARYRHALEPLMLLLIAWAATEAFSGLQKQKKTAASLDSVVTLTIALPICILILKTMQPKSALWCQKV